jgi:hypothetical protein
MSRVSPCWKDPDVFQDLSRILEIVVMTPYIHSGIFSFADAY